MAVSLLNTAITNNSPSLTGALAQRAYGQEAASATAAAAIPDIAPERAADIAQGAASVNVFSTAPIGSQTGIAAYIAVMNPQTAASMRVEA